jgi:hypothetical protein
MNDLEHPKITCTLETGYPDHPSGVCTCAYCGCSIREDDPYYEIAGVDYCPDCVQEARRYA